MNINIIEQSTSERYQEMERKYEEYLELYYTTELPIREIKRRLDIPQRGEISKYIDSRIRKEHIDSFERGLLIRSNRWNKDAIEDDEENDKCRWCNCNDECLLFDVVCDEHCGIKS